MGYDSNRFTDLPVFLEEELTCTICYSILCKAVITPCGHAFCRDCILTWFEHEKTCPVCRKAVTKVCKPPVIVSNLLSRLKLVCAFKQKGCSEVLSLDQIERHEAGCRFRTKQGFFRSLIRTVIPSFISLMNTGTMRIHPFDGDDAEEDFDMQDRYREVDIVPTFPLIFALAAAGMFYKSMYVLLHN